MRKLLIYLSNSHENIFKAFIILVALWLMAIMLPHKVRYKFDIKKGAVWNYDDLVAPFDFAIYKDPDSLEAEKIRIASSVLPHFVFDTTAFGTAMSELERRLSTVAAGSIQRALMIESGKHILSELYSQGIVNPSDVDKAGPKGRVMVVTGKLSRSAFISDFHTPASAGSFLSSGAGLPLAGDTEQLVTLIGRIITPNVYYDAAITTLVTDQQQRMVSATYGMIRKGELIISRGQQVSGDKYMLLESLRKATNASQPDSDTIREIFLSQVMVIAISLAMLLLFLALLRKDIFADNRKLTLIFTLMIMVVGIYTGVLRMSTLSVYVVPLCILPVVIRVFFDTRLALFTHVSTVLILGSVAPNGYEFVFIQVIAGMVTIFSVSNLRKRAQLFVSAGMILIAYVVSYLTLAVLHEGNISDIEISNLYWLTGNVLLTLFAYPMIYIFEKVFGLTSDISLMELSDTNSPLLRELSIKAPGTFQHSMQVANLAEAAAFRIGGNTLLVRVGALYHDIGKMDMPLYFIENQSTAVNPHDELSFEESASIIISHVIKGIEKARKHKLPDLIIDFIRTHHGTSMVQYFYQSFLKNFPEKIVDEEDFRYPGPLPFSKETAVLMMADSVEASSRSLKIINHETINQLVDNIIDKQIENQQFVNCDITFKDISSIKKIFKKMLMSIYHVRVEYPGR